MRNYTSKKIQWIIATGGLLALFAIMHNSSVSDAIFEMRCGNSLGPAAVNVNVSPVEFALDNSLSVAMLTRRYPPPPPSITLGMTTATLLKDLSVKNNGLKQPITGRLCTRPHVSVVLSFTPMKVFVASDYPVNSCKYNEIYAHEMRHVNTYKTYLPIVAEEIRQQIASALGEKIHYYRDSKVAQRTVDTLLDATWMPYVTRKMAEVEVEQAKIDTTEEYERLANVCQN